MLEYLKNKTSLCTIQIAFTPLVCFILLTLIHQLKKYVASTFNYTFILLLLTIFIYILIGILLAWLSRMPHEILSKITNQILFILNILFCFTIEIMPFVGIFVLFTIDGLVYLNHILLGFYTYLLIHSFKKK